MHRMVTGVYGDTDGASRAVRSLLDAHFEPDDIRVVVSAPGGRRAVPLEYTSPWGRGAAIGALAGALLGALGAVLVSAGVLPAPGVGLLTGGAVVSALKAALVLGALGALSGYIVALAVWSNEPRIRGGDVAGGRILVGVLVASRRIDPVRRVLEQTAPLEVTVCAPGDAACEQAAV